jgi:hypothetical protein
VASNAKISDGPTGPAQPGDLPDRARQVLDTLAGLEPELRAAAVLSGTGEVLASTSDDEAFRRSATDFAEALAAAGPGELDSSHVATEEAEVFLVSESGFRLVAVTARFVLASLTSFDIRMSLRDLAAEVRDA